MNQNTLHRLGNGIGLVIISALLIIAFATQLFRHDLPCPLCLLQRICFVAIGLCFCMNLTIGIKPSHYGLMSLSSLLGLGIALRQIFLHLAPGDPGYGQLLLGFHMYIWSAIAFTIILLLIATALLFEQGFIDGRPERRRGKFALMIFFFILILANGISTLIECGTLICPDNPIRYELLETINTVN